MGKQVVLQPDGKLAVWSTIVDAFVMYDATIEDVVEDDLQELRRRLTEQLTEVVEKLKRGEKPYRQFTKTYDECVSEIAERYGDDDECVKAMRSIQKGHRDAE